MQDTCLFIHGNNSRLNFATMFVKNMAVSGRLSSRPSPANTMVAETVPKKTSPSEVPQEFHTCKCTMLSASA